MEKNKTLVRKLLAHLICGLFVINISGCGSVKHKLNFLDNYAPQPLTRIEVGHVTNETGQTFDIDIKQMLADSLTEALRKQKLLWAGGTSPKLLLNSKIVGYEKGSAFKRWLLPGYGSTVLSIEGELRDEDRLVASFQARRTVSFGGGYTIGAWKTIFADVAKDIVKDIRSQIPK